jgi:hypothetical protein
VRALLALLLAAPLAAQACGYCVEDKVASVYDHAAVMRALEAKQTVVYFAIDGALHVGDAQKRKLEDLVASTNGVEKGSVRLAMETATLALSFDPRRINLGRLQNALEQRLSPLGLSLLPMRVMERPGDLAAVRTRPR